MWLATAHAPTMWIAAGLLRFRRCLDADQIKIFADVNVKHSAPLAPHDLLEEVKDAIERGLANAIVVTGRDTGKGTRPSDVQAAKALSETISVFVGSGVSTKTLHEFHAMADGFIVGTALKRDVSTHNPVDVRRVSDFVRQLRSYT